MLIPAAISWIQIIEYTDEMYQNIKLKHERRSDNDFIMGITDKKKSIAKKISQIANLIANDILFTRRSRFPVALRSPTRLYLRVYY